MLLFHWLLSYWIRPCGQVSVVRVKQLTSFDFSVIDSSPMKIIGRQLVRGLLVKKANSSHHHHSVRLLKIDGGILWCNITWNTYELIWWYSPENLYVHWLSIDISYTYGVSTSRSANMINSVMVRRSEYRWTNSFERNRSNMRWFSTASIRTWLGREPSKWWLPFGTFFCSTG